MTKKRINNGATERAPLNRENLTNRLAQLETQFESVKAQANQIAGAIMLTKQLIAETETCEKEPAN